MSEPLVVPKIDWDAPIPDAELCPFPAMFGIVSVGGRKVRWWPRRKPSLGVDCPGD